MSKPAISVCLDDFRLEVRAAMDRAQAMGFRAVDVGATVGPISPDELSTTGRRHLLKHLADLGLRLGSLRGPVGGAGYGDKTGGERRVETMRQVLRLAQSLHVPVVSTALGLPGARASGPDADLLGEALSAIADEADRTGVIAAVEPAGVSASNLARMLRQINCPYLAACCDSGAMLMQGDDPHRIAETLPGRIRLVRARDAVSGSAEKPGYEVGHGDGHLDTERFLAAMNEAGFEGDIVLSRTAGEKPIADLERARIAFAKHLQT